MLTDIGVLDENGIFNFAKIVSGVELVKQRVRESVLTLRGENESDINMGVYWLRYLNADLTDQEIQNSLKDEISRAVYYVEDVNTIENINITRKDGNNNKPTICVEIQYTINDKEESLNDVIDVS